MSEDRKSIILDKVRKLLAKAASTPFEGEADLFRAKADELMTAYAIEAWQVEQGSDKRVEPEKRMINMSWYWVENAMINDQLWSLMHHVARHCRCVIVPKYIQARHVPVIGMPADLDYMDMLFTDLMLQLIGQIEPKPSKDLSYHENLKQLREAGVSWPEAAKLMLAAGFDPRPNDTSFKVKQDQMTRDYRTWCKKTGTPQNYANWKTYRRNFAYGFVGSIAERLQAMREVSQGESEPTGSMALALRDIRQVVNDAVFNFFPDLNKKKSVTKYVKDTRKIDLSAISSGSRAGAEARIASGSAQLKTRKQLG